MHQMINEHMLRFAPKAKEFIADEHLLKKLELGRPLNIKAGFDPTAPDLHLGHTIVLDQLKIFQDQGHKVTVVIGDFTAKIGDPTGKNATRPALSDELIHFNTMTYCDQAFKILDKTKTQLAFNSRWLDKLGASGLIGLSSHYTVARMLERDDFQKRFSSNKSIAIHEFLYPLLQGYDSVALEADIEVGGIDQKFNLLMGRELQRAYSQIPQSIIMLPLLEGLDGVNKMSKSLGNYIGITDDSKQMFGKVMSISDDLMWRYFETLSTCSNDELLDSKNGVALGEKNPRDLKVLLAKELICRYWSHEHACEAEQSFFRQFSANEVPDDVPEMVIPSGDGHAVSIVRVLKMSGLVDSHSEASRMIQQGAVRCNKDRVSDKDLLLPLGKFLIQVGKRRFCWVTVS
ncbi:tyrosine--tRNA ligase [Candidatus Ichthyocystis hellenicum]|uniref:tyrosine--tRNA ligase n=1 Tax=Candidatus Ichthyocystis hellenicum TaxID=1561003 RepID=UPI000AADAEE3|nr:tyrosine--tRNA ligase [Candidatus Ichthyocystis hellenicum]